MKKGKMLLMVLLLAAMALTLCACSKTPDPEKTVIWRDEDGQTELERVTYNPAKDAEPGFTAPDKDGKTFDRWDVLVDEDATKVYQAVYEKQGPSYPVHMPNGITVLGGTPGVDGQNCENLFDDDNATAWCVNMNENARAYVEWSTPEPVELHGVWATTAENSGMNPQVWRVSYTEDGQNWKELYSATKESNIITEANLWRGIGINFFYTDTGDTFIQTAQHFRLEVEQTRGDSFLKLVGFGISTEG